MTVQDLVIVGAGGHGRELYATVAAANAEAPLFRVLGFVDDRDDHPERVQALGAPRLGDVTWLEEHPSRYALGIGTSAVRTTVAGRLDDAGCRPATVIHPGAEIGPEVELGHGVVIYARSVITTNVRIGAHTHLNVGCAVQHDSTVGDFVQMSPGVLVNGDCTIGDGVFLGTGAIVTRGCSVGAGARVGAGAVVLDDVAPDTTVVGTPARPPG
jgi:sugar O-acyltransferase (sialic acid O-acetyltransferase NeuD family)